MLPRRTAALAAAALSSAAVLVVSGPTTAPVAAAPRAETVRSGSFALAGADADAYPLPGDLRRVRSTELSAGRTADRYQQVVGGAAVFGAQVTVLRDAAGEVDAVIGAHFPGLRPVGPVEQTGADARAVVEDAIGERGDWTTRLRLDPASGRFYYAVESIRAWHRPVRWVDARTGRVRKAYDAFAEGSGTGVRGDRRTLDTTPAAGGFALRSADGRHATYDAGDGGSLPGALMTDADDLWDATSNKFRSPDQRPGVDAHYYTGVVDRFFRETFGRDGLDGHGTPVVSTVHVGKKYCNASWNGEQMSYGDGGGKDCLPLSGALDVVAHELTHGITDHTSDLVYEGESGALNEAFSDIVATTAEFHAARTGTDPGATPDWRIGEDAVVARRGFRNMADPHEYGDPDHYAERYTGTEDAGGVHINSAIPNHAYHLLVEGGRNAGCGGAPSGHTHAAHCDVTVTGIGLDRAAQVFYDAFTSLPEYASFCDARNATAAVAAAGTADVQSVRDAWAAVGVTGDCTPAGPPPPPCESDDAATVPFESPHPYGNEGDCTWTYEHGSPGFAFRFSLLDTEEGYDVVQVRDGTGAVVAEYTGTARKPVVSPCLATSTGSVRLVTDETVTAQGFVVDAALPCTPR
jgi:bacillolysin